MFMPNMQHIGQLTGVGDAHVFGLARHLVDDDRADLIYLNMAGPVTSVESVWARLVEGGTVTFRGSDRSLTRHLRHHGLEDGAPFVRYQRRIPGLAIDHLLLLDRRFVEVTYGEVGVAFLFDAPSLSLKVCEHVRQLINLPVFPDWAERLAEIGRLTRLLRPADNIGEQQVYQLNLDRTRWEQQIALRVERGELPWPGDDTPVKPLSDIPSLESETGESQSGGKVGRIPQSRISGNPRSANHLPAPPTANPDIPFTVTHQGDWTWVSFPHKPEDAILTRLKAAGFRWSKRRREWYAQIRLDTDEIKSLIA